MELQKEIGHFEVLRGTGSLLCQIALWDCFRDVFLLAITRLPEKLFQDLLSLNNVIVQCHTTLTQFPAELVRLSEDGNKNAYVYACVHLSFKVSP